MKKKHVSGIQLFRCCYPLITKFVLELSLGIHFEDVYMCSFTVYIYLSTFITVSWYCRFSFIVLQCFSSIISLHEYQVVRTIHWWGYIHEWLYYPLLTLIHWSISCNILPDRVPAQGPQSTLCDRQQPTAPCVSRCPAQRGQIRENRRCGAGTIFRVTLC